MSRSDGAHDAGAGRERELVALPLDGITDALVVLDRDWRYVHVNARAGALVGRAPEALIGRHIWAEFPEGVGQPFHEAYERALATQSAIRLEACYAPWDRWFENRVFPTADGLLILFTETTEQRRAQAVLARSEARFRSLSASSPVGIFEADNAGRVTYANPRATEIWAMPEAELLGMGWTARIHPDDLAGVLARWRAARAAGADHGQEYRLLLPDGTVRWVHGRSAPLRDAEGAMVGAVGTIEDVTERRALEARLRQAQKLEAVGQLAGGIAHDFNNLLTVIQANLEFVSDDLPPDHASRTDLAHVVAAAERARTLVRQLLAFGRAQELAVRCFDVNDVVRDTERLLRRAIGEEIALDVSLDDRTLYVETDPVQFEQVLLNLAINARDAMLTPLHGHAGAGGVLSIETDAVTLTRGDADACDALDPGRYVRLTVRDTGHGMDAATASHAFEPFFSTKPVGSGTGLGLATVYGVVTQSGGAIRVESEPGRGTTFTILLPRAADDAADGDIDTSARAVSGGRAGHGTVLLVEDEGTVRDATRRLLERHGYAVLEARHGADALLVWRQHHAAIAAVVTDVRMPELGGRELVAVLRAEAPALPVVYVSGYVGQQGNAAPHPNEVFVEKPFTSEALLGALARVLATPRA